MKIYVDLEQAKSLNFINILLQRGVLDRAPIIILSFIL